MIKNIKITSDNDFLFIPFENAQEEPYLVTNIDGLGPLNATVNTSENGFVDGGEYISSHIGIRPITIYIQYNNDSGIPVESLRNRIVRLASVKKEIRLDVETSLRNYYIYGVVEKNEQVIFSYTCGAVISMLCPYPFFKTQEKATATNSIEQGVTFPIINSHEESYEILLGKPDDWDEHFYKYYYINNGEYVINYDPIWNNSKTYYYKVITPEIIFNNQVINFYYINNDSTQICYPTITIKFIETGTDLINKGIRKLKINCLNGSEYNEDMILNFGETDGGSFTYYDWVSQLVLNDKIIIETEPGKKSIKIHKNDSSIINIIYALQDLKKWIKIIPNESSISNITFNYLLSNDSSEDLLCLYNVSWYERYESI